MDGKMVEGLKTRVGRECCIGRVGALMDQVEQRRNTSRRSPKRKAECRKVCDLRKKQKRSKENSFRSESCLEF